MSSIKVMRFLICAVIFLLNMNRVILSKSNETNNIKNFNETYIRKNIYHANIEFHLQQIHLSTGYTSQNNNYVDEVLNEEFDTYVIYPWSWKEPELEVPWYVFIVPMFAVIVLTMNCTIVAVFVRENLLSSMNLLLIGIAVSDTLTVLLPTPMLIYIYAFENIPEEPYHLCQSWDYVIKYTPIVTHSASVFLTLCLAVHRYIGVCFPFYARHACTRRKSIIAIIACYFFAIAIHMCRFVDTEYIPVTINHPVRNESIVTCKATHARWLQGVEVTYECAYYWIYIIAVKIIPCFSLIVFDAMMLRQIRKADDRRLQILSRSRSGNSENGHRKYKESRRLTFIIIIIVGIVCLVEFPLAVVLIIWTLSMIHTHVTISEEFLSKASVFFNLLIYTSYPIIFLLYCFMSGRFKQGITNLCKCHTDKIKYSATSKDI